MRLFTVPHLLIGAAALVLCFTASCVNSSSPLLSVAPIAANASPVDAEPTAEPQPLVEPPANPFPDRDLAALKNGLGAAHFLPGDCSAFTMVLNPDELALNFWNSAPMQKIRQTPGAMMALQRMPQEDPFRGLLQFLQSPPGQEVAALLRDMVDQELFIASDARTPSRIDAMLQLYNAAFLAGLENGLRQRNEDISPKIFVDMVLEQREKLGIPAGILGIRLKNVEPAKALLDRFLFGATAQMPPGMYARNNPTEAWAHNITIPLKMIVEPQRFQLMRGLMREGVPLEKVNQLFDWLMTHSIHINLTIRDNYLLLHVGPDQAFINKWGAETPLGASKDFQMARSLQRESLAYLSYHNTELMGILEWTPERLKETEEQLATIIKTTKEIPPEIAKRMQEDLTEIVPQVAADIPDPAPLIACTFAEQGLRSYVARPGRKSKVTVDAELELAALADKAAMLSSTQNTMVRANDIDVISSVLQKMFGYFEDFALEKMRPKEQENARTVIAALRTFGGSLRDIAKGDLAKAIGETSMSTMVVENGGTVIMPPGVRDFPQQLSIPRFGLAMRLQDSAALIRSVVACKEAILKLGRSLSALPGSNIPEDLNIPDPEVKNGDGWTSYGYATPLGEDVQPTAIVTDKLLLIGLSPKQLHSLRERDAGKKPKQEKHSMTMRLDVGAWAQYFLTVGKELYDHQNRRRFRRRAQNMQQEALIMMHLQVVVDAIKHIEVIEVIQKQRGEFAITESWIRTR